MSQAVQSEISAETLRILLIEDNPGDAFLVQEFLSDSGSRSFELIHRERLDDGFARIEQSGID